jgi:hypothetical protein
MTKKEWRSQLISRFEEIDGIVSSSSYSENSFEGKSYIQCRGERDALAWVIQISNAINESPLAHIKSSRGYRFNIISQTVLQSLFGSKLVEKDYALQILHENSSEKKSVDDWNKIYARIPIAYLGGGFKSGMFSVSIKPFGKYEGGPGLWFAEYLKGYREVLSHHGALSETLQLPLFCEP